MAWYAEAKTWQTAIGATVGFIGLIVGALFNAHLNRRRDDRVRRQEADSLASALYGEIIQIRQRLAALCSGIARRHLDYGEGFGRREPYDQHFFSQYPLPEPLIYKSIIPKIGILSSDLILGVARFYADYDMARAHLPKLLSDPTRGFTYGPAWVLRPAIEAINDVQTTLLTIERLIGVAQPSAAPSTGQAEMVIEMENYAAQAAVAAQE